MNYTIDKKKYITEKNKITKFIDLNKKLPEKIFNESIKYFNFFSSDYIFLEDFWNIIKMLLTSDEKEKSFNLLVLEPDPENYYYEHFKKYPLLNYSLNLSFNNFLSSLHEDPGNSPADAIATRGEVILFYSKTLNWIIYIDIILEIGILAFKNPKMNDHFLNILTKTNDLYFFLPKELENSDLYTPSKIMNKISSNFSKCPDIS